MKKTVIILNGPPGCGKDTIANYTQWKFKWAHRRMKSHLIDLALLMTKIPRREWNNRYKDRTLKEEAWDKLPNNFSQREFLIHLSESMMKPLFGKNYFGAVQAKEVALSNSGISIYSDGGFVEEIEELAEVVDSLFVVQLSRDGCEWGIDSRSYISLDLPNTRTFSASNNTSIETIAGYIYEQITGREPSEDYR